MLTFSGIAELKSQNQNEIDKKFIVPYPQNSRFIGRTKFLQTLKEKLIAQSPNRDNHRVALYGTSGIGKTQIALEYVYANRGYYDKIYWIIAVDQASLLSGFQRIAEKERLVTPETNPSQIAEIVLAWLRQEKSWLIVIDNLDDIEVVKGFLPENSPGKHTLITTRNLNSAGIPAEGLEVPLLELKEAVDLLLTLSNIAVAPQSAEKRQAEEIVEELGHTPLAIAQAATYIREVTGNFETYCKEYKESWKTIHEWVPKGTRSYSYSVATTWFMLFKVVQEAHAEAAQLFQLLSFLNPEGILVDFLLAGAEALEENVRKLLSNQSLLAIALLELEKFSLLKWNRITKTISIDRLTQSVVRDGMSEEELSSYFDTIIELCCLSFPLELTNATRPLCQIYQGQVVQPLLQAKTRRTKRCAEIMGRVSFFLREDGKFRDSEKLQLQVVEIRTELEGSDHEFTLMSMNHLALIYRWQGRTTEAAKLNEEVLTKMKMVLGEDHPETLTTMTNLAETYRWQGRIREAAELNEEVLAKMKIFGDDQSEMLTAMNNLALTYKEQGRMTEAAQLNEKVWAKMKTMLGEDNTMTLTSMNNLAETYWHQGRMTEAAKLQEEVYAKMKKILKEDHPNTLLAANNLAEMYKQQGRTAEASKLQEEGFAKLKATLGENHSQTLLTMNSLAETYWLQGRASEALKLQNEVLTKTRTILKEDHPMTLHSIHNLAEMYRQLDRTTEAGKLNEEVLTKRKMILGGDHPETLKTMNNLALVYWRQGRMGEAIELQEEMSAKMKTILGENHPSTILGIHNLAKMKRRQPWAKRTGKLNEEVLAKDDPGRGSSGNAHDHEQPRLEVRKGGTDAKDNGAEDADSNLKDQKG